MRIFFKERALRGFSCVFGFVMGGDRLRCVIFLLLLVIPVTASCQEIGEQTAISAQLVEKHPEPQYGSEMYYLYKDPDNPTIYIVMHGLDNRLVMNGISVKSALNKVLKENKDKLGYFSTIKVVCCFSNKHKNFFSKTWNANVEFIVDSDKKLVVYAGTRGFRFFEWED